MERAQLAVDGEPLELGWGNGSKRPMDGETAGNDRVGHEISRREKRRLILQPEHDAAVRQPCAGR